MATYAYNTRSRARPRIASSGDPLPSTSASPGVCRPSRTLSSTPAAEADVIIERQLAQANKKRRSWKRRGSGSSDTVELQAQFESSCIVDTNEMPSLQRKIKLVTEQHKIDKPSPVEAYPMREWSIKIYMVDSAGNEQPADCFNKVVFNLHPSFENPVQTFTKPPYECVNEGWGEFELSIDCYYTEKTKISVPHDLNFQKERYEVVQSITFKNPSQVLQEKLRELGPLPNDDDRPKKKAGAAGKKSSSQKIDYEKIAAALEKLEEEDLLKAIQIIHDFKSTDTYIKSDVDTGEFSIDLYTMPDVLTKNLWDYLSTKSLVA